jgi:hypothetical protein
LTGSVGAFLESCGGGVRLCANTALEVGVLSDAGDVVWTGKSEVGDKPRVIEARLPPMPGSASRLDIE